MPAKESPYRIAISLKRVFRVVLLLVTLLTFFALWYGEGFDWRTYAAWRAEAPPVFVAIIGMTFLPLLGFPIFICYCLMGFFYSIGTAFWAGSLSLLLNMSVGYWLASSLFREPVSKFIHKRWPNLLLFNRLNLIRTTILIRTVPGVPYCFQNYILGVLNVPFAKYLAISWLFQSVFLLSVILTIKGGARAHPGYLATGLLVLLFAIAASRYMMKQARKSLYEKENTYC